MKAFPTNDPQHFGESDAEGMDLKHYFAAHSGKEAIEFLNLYYGKDWARQGETKALQAIAKAKLRIARFMVNELKD